jgi:hypothetical protein
MSAFATASESQEGSNMLENASRLLRAGDTRRGNR